MHMAWRGLSLDLLVPKGDIIFPEGTAAPPPNLFLSVLGLTNGVEWGIKYRVFSCGRQKRGEDP
jgi:hypothetical protein